MFLDNLFYILSNYTQVSLHENCPNKELFVVRISLYSDCIWTFTEQISVFSTNTGKYGPEITLYLDTFEAVITTSMSLALFTCLLLFHLCSPSMVYNFFCQHFITFALALFVAAGFGTLILPSANICITEMKYASF